MEKMNWQKLGLWALAGFGAFALYERYGKKSPEVVILEEEEETSDFTGTRWQNRGRDTTTSWQQRGVFSNYKGGDLSPDEARSVSRMSFTTRPFGGKRGRYVGMQGTGWQRSGQALNSGTNWQDVNLNACGSCGA